MRLCLLAASVALVAAGCGDSGSVPTAPARVPLPRKAECRGHEHPLVGVHHPDRLKLIASCRVIVGTVMEPEISQDDGDAVFDVTPDPAYKTLLNQENVKRDGLHVEIVPADQPGCQKGELLVNPNVPDLGRCTGRHIPLPKTGQHVRAVGAYVLDTNHGWREIHPAWKVTVVPRPGG
jgi:hypothetical protein